VAANAKQRSVRIVPVILCGGAGSRLWPLSRDATPKQFLSLIGEGTLLQNTLRRVSDREVFAPPVVVTGAEHRFTVAEQLQHVGEEQATILLEPTARNTAAAVAVAALAALRDDPGAIMLVMPADHVILEPDAFVGDAQACADWAAQGFSVLFGITPTEPATGYGYIRAGARKGEDGAVFEVAGFVEKPDAVTAARHIADGCLWNSGVFLLSAGSVLSELDVFEPAVAAAARASFEGARADMDFVRLEAMSFGSAPSISIDNAVMERTRGALVRAASWKWTDIGAWSTLWELGAKDACGNVHVGPSLSQDAHDCYLRSEGPALAVVGMNHAVVVATADAVLVAAKSSDQQVKSILGSLSAAGISGAGRPRRVQRPWGHFEMLDGGDRFQVKRITVMPGEQLSLQTHARRDEHWVVVNGVADVRLGEISRRLGENESVYIPQGMAHRLSNPGASPLRVIEVQFGGYLGEDDIVRLEDIYQRV